MMRHVDGQSSLLPSYKKQTSYSTPDLQSTLSVSYSMGVWGSSPEGEVVEAYSWPYHLVPRPGMRGVMPPLPLPPHSVAFV
jgi:hypothetical protein